jgi:hypothetical protein
MLNNGNSQAGRDTLLPRARVDNLVVREMPDETLVYDLKTHKAHCLNQAATLTWKHCDGKITVADMTSILSVELKIQVDEDAVWLALGKLGRAHLLEERVIPPAESPKLSRREVVRRLGLGGAVALPVVMSIIAPTVVGAQTCRANGVTCTTGPQCCSMCCSDTPTTSGTTETCLNSGSLMTGDSCSVNCACSSGMCSMDACT